MVENSRQIARAMRSGERADVRGAAEDLHGRVAIGAETEAGTLEIGIDQAIRINEIIKANFAAP